MKKIIGIIAAVAMAASVFALNDATGMSANVRFGHASYQNWWDNSSASNYLFEFDGANVNLLDYKNNMDAFTLSLDLGIVGGSIEPDGKTNGKIWFKPFWGDDMLKITIANDLGAAGDMLCGAGVDYYGIACQANKFQYAGGGYQIESKPIDKLKVGAVLKAGNGAFWSANYNTNFYASYDDAETVGKIAAYFGAASTFTDLMFGLGWTRGFGDDFKITPTLNVIGYADNSGLTKVRIEPTIAGSVDPLSFAVFVPVNIALPAGTVSMDAAATVDYKVADDGAFTKLWLKFGYKNVLSGAIDMQFQLGCGGKLSDSTSWEFRAEPNIKGTAVNVVFGPGLIGNYGGMSWDIGAKFTIAPSAANVFSVVVPFTVALSL